MPISWYLVFKDIQLMQVTLTKISRSECESTVMGQGTTSSILGVKVTGGKGCVELFSLKCIWHQAAGWMNIPWLHEEHLKYVFKGSLHYLCWLGVILGREQQILLSQFLTKTRCGQFWEKHEEKKFCMQI